MTVTFDLLPSASLSSFESKSSSGWATTAKAPGHSSRRLALVDTAWGQCGVVWRLPAPQDLGYSITSISPFAEAPIHALLCRMTVPGLPAARLRNELQKDLPAAEVFPDQQGRFPSQLVPNWFGELQNFLQGYFSNITDAPLRAFYADVWSYWKPRLDLAALSPFQQKVLDLVGRIPRGQVRTYGQIAKQLGRPTAARAVGAVMRTNPWPILIPCHRVIGASGNLTGYSGTGSLNTKKKLLEMEEVAGLEGMRG